MCQSNEFDRFSLKWIWFIFYRSGNGGFGGGLESRSILSMLCEVRRFFVCDCSNMSRSRGVNGISGRDVRWVFTSGRCNVLLLVFGFVVPPFFSRSVIFSLASCTKFYRNVAKHNIFNVKRYTKKQRQSIFERNCSLTWTAFSTSSTTSVTFSWLNDAQFASSSLNNTSSHSLISLPRDRYTCVVAEIIALLFSFNVYGWRAVCTLAIVSKTTVPLAGNTSNRFRDITPLKCCSAFFTCRTW